MKNLFALCAVLVLLSGCSSTPETKFVTRVETVTIFKPVYTPPKDLQNLPDIVRPDLATNQLSKTDKENPGYVVKVVIESMAQLRSYAETLEARIQIYKQTLEQPADPVPEPTTTVETFESTIPVDQ